MKLKLFFALSLSIVLMVSCKKGTIAETKNSSEALIIKFFKSETKISSEILNLKIQLQNVQKKNPYAEKVIEIAGFPKWDKTIKVANKKSSYNSAIQNNQNLEPSFIIPIVGLTEANVTGAIIVESGSLVPYHLILLKDFAQHGLSKESFITAMMLLDSRVFGYDKFKINSNSIQKTQEVFLKNNHGAKNFSSSKSTSNLEGDCEEIEIWYNPDGDACNCNGDEYDTGVRQYVGNCEQQTTSILLPSGGAGGMNTSLPPYYYPLIGLGEGGGGNQTPSNTPYIPVNYFTPAHFLLAGHLNLILGIGDTYYFTETGNPNQSFSFNTVGEFQFFLNDNNANQKFDIKTPPTIINQNEKIEHAKINLIGIGGVDISCKLYKSGSLWQVTNVSSTEYGLSFSWSWEQTT